MGPGVSINSNQSDSFSPELPDENREEPGEESCCVGTFVWIMCTLLPIRKKKKTIIKITFGGASEPR